MHLEPLHQPGQVAQVCRDRLIPSTLSFSRHDVHFLLYCLSVGRSTTNRAVYVQYETRGRELARKRRYSNGGKGRGSACAADTHTAARRAVRFDRREGVRSGNSAGHCRPSERRAVNLLRAFSRQAGVKEASKYTRLLLIERFIEQQYCRIS